MAAKTDAPEADAGGAEPAAPATKFSLPIVPLLNTLAILGAVGFGAYSKLVYKRPPFREESERERLVKTHATPAAEGAPTFSSFGPITANIASNPETPAAADGTFKQIDGKLHYVTLSFSMELRAGTEEATIEVIRPQFLDKLNHLLGKKQFHDLTTVQGRYILQAQLLEIANRLLATVEPSASEPVMNIFFTQFIVQ